MTAPQPPILPEFDRFAPLPERAEALRLWLDQDAAARDRAGGRPLGQIAALRAAGLPAARIPRDLGGEGAAWSEVMAAVRIIAQTDGSVAHLYGYHHLPLTAAILVGTTDQRDRLIRRGAAENWLWGNAGNIMDNTASGIWQGDHWLVDGVKPFASGSHVADLIQISWNDASGQRHLGLIPGDHPGLIVNDDWDGIGQRQTGSGTVRFDNLRVDAADVLPDVAQAVTPQLGLLSLLQQAVLMNVFIGSAEGALATARAYTLSQARPWVDGGYARHADDPYVIRSYGQHQIRILAARALADEALAALDAADARGGALTPAERGELAVILGSANLFAQETGLAVSEEIFAVMGARSATRANGFDRFWRNARTHSLHNPAEYKKRMVGDWLLTGAYPEPGVYR